VLVGVGVGVALGVKVAVGVEVGVGVGVADEGATNLTVTKVGVSVSAGRSVGAGVGARERGASSFDWQAINPRPRARTIKRLMYRIIDGIMPRGAHASKFKGPKGFKNL